MAHLRLACLSVALLSQAVLIAGLGEPCTNSSTCSDRQVCSRGACSILTAVAGNALPTQEACMRVEPICSAGTSCAPDGFCYPNVAADEPAPLTEARANAAPTPVDALPSNVAADVLVGGDCSEANPCAIGLACDALTSTCVATNFPTDLPNQSMAPPPPAPSGAAAGLPPPAVSPGLAPAPQAPGAATPGDSAATPGEPSPLRGECSRDQPCEFGLTCDTATVEGRCVDMALTLPAGSACEELDICALGSQCVNGVCSGGPGTTPSTPPPPSGQGPSGAGQGQQPSGSDAAEPALPVLEGGSCNSEILCADGQAGWVCLDGICYRAGPPELGTADVGEFCDGATPCQTGLDCVRGLCEPLDTSAGEDSGVAADSGAGTAVDAAGDAAATGADAAGDAAAMGADVAGDAAATGANAAGDAATAAGGAVANVAGGAGTAAADVSQAAIDAAARAELEQAQAQRELSAAPRHLPAALFTALVASSALFALLL